MGGAWEEVRAAAADTASGAAEIARRAAETLALLPASDLPEAVRALVRGHPPMAPLWRLGDVVLSSRDHAAAAARFVSDLDHERDAIARDASRVLDNEIVTHSYSSTLVAAVAGAGVTALCGRSDPGGEGARTAERLTSLGVEARLVDDDGALWWASNGRTVVTGADAVGPGGVVNKVGTAALAEAAGRCYAVAGSSKFLGADPPAPVPFERVPLHLFAGIVTDVGVLTPEDAAGLAGRFELHPALADLLD
ncbi:MAG: hypothetical protein ACRDKA_12540 [Actinomycetota bacterium]